MEAILSSITKQSGTYQSGSRKGEAYEMFLAIVTNASIRIVGNIGTAYTIPIFNDKVNHFVFDFLSTISVDEDGNVDMEELREACLKKASEAKTEADKDYWNTFMDLGTSKFDHKTGKPYHGCITVKSKRLPIGEPNADGTPSKWKLMNNGEQVTRRGKPVVETHRLVYWQEVYDITIGEWIPVEGANSEDAAYIALEKDRDRLYEPEEDTSTGAAFVKALMEDGDDNATTEEVVEEAVVEEVVEEAPATT